MVKQFNLLRYKELLKLEKNNKITFLDPELVGYGANIESQIYYNRKEEYFSLIEKYLKRKLSGYEFRSKFLKMEIEDGKTAYTIARDFEKLEAFTLADDLEDFSNLIVEISTLCSEYGDIWSESMKPMSESEFYSLVNQHYFQLAKLFSAVSTNNLPYQKLLDRSFKSLAGIIGLGILLIFYNISEINLIKF